MTLVTTLIFLVAVSLVVGYILIIHRSLSGGAANDPQFDANAPQQASSGRRPSQAPAKSGPVAGTARHA
jgi:hypothetical protein